MPDPLDSAFAALAHPARRAMLAALADGPRRATDLADACGGPGGGFLGHAVALTEAGLITAYVDGHTRMVACSPRALEAVTEWLAAQGLAVRSVTRSSGSPLDVLFGGPVPLRAAPTPGRGRATLTAA